MGDRCYVSLYVLSEQAQTTEVIFNHEASEGPIDEGVLTYWGFEEVNYGELTFLEALKAAGIAYLACVGGGSDYGPREEYLRFTPEGEALVWDIHEGEADTIGITHLRKALDAPDATLESVRAYVDNYVAEITPLPWDNQVQYGKVYRTLQLISK